ncbi:helix-turn-helix domain-containing protein [Streptomyces sp. NPDC003027]
MHGLTSDPPAPAYGADTAPGPLTRFDRLLGGVTDADALVRAAAWAAGCCAGLTDHHHVLRSSPEGRPLDPGKAAPSARRTVFVDGHSAGEVWIERAGSPSPLDEPLLERMARAASAVLAGGDDVPPSPGAEEAEMPAPDPWWPPGLGDPALVQAVLAPRMPETERSRALHLLGLAPVGLVRAAAVVVPEPTALRPALAACAAALHVPHARAGSGAPRGALWPTVGAILLPGPASPRGGPAVAPRDVAVGIGPAVAPERLPDSWSQARRAARFAGLGPTWPTVVPAPDLGALALLADIPAAAALAHPDVMALARLGAEQDGAQTLATLEAVCRTRSLREAAKLLSLHHSSVAQRVARAERTLDMSLTDPSGRQRVQTALLLWQLNAPGNWRG